MTDRKGRVITAAVVMLVAAGILVASVLLPWYALTSSGGGISIHGFYYAGPASENGTIRYTCSGAPVACPSQSSYSSQNLNNTGTLAETGFYLLIAGIVLGVAAMGLALMRRDKSGGLAPAMILGIVALVIAIAAPGVYALELPHAISSDFPGVQGSGPWTSFFGSNTTGGEGFELSNTWGPGTGWYLAIGAFVVFWVGVILLFRQIREDRALAPESQPKATGSPSPTDEGSPKSPPGP